MFGGKFSVGQGSLRYHEPSALVRSVQPYRFRHYSTAVRPCEKTSGCSSIHLCMDIAFARQLCGCFATALVSTFFSPTRTLAVCNAGHPLPLLRDARTGRWNSSEVGTDEKPSNNMPIGVVDDGGYRSTQLRLRVNDMVLTYTDSLSEAKNRDGRMLGTQGVCDMVNAFSSLPPESLIPRLLEAIR